MSARCTALNLFARSPRTNKHAPYDFFNAGGTVVSTEIDVPS
ncbi:hypothetical protein SV7mr_16420 [Stieleria bergensis]|uniref:Uncharacterized protein n=1 Tax=Stieleria bergensis TaxID=2528025 RepID=A0A517SSN1_9BACT|nr:hypothetical protein SV7mr_16420 [Planctomycetes bacterium SV_7m_r]